MGGSTWATDVSGGSVLHCSAAFCTRLILICSCASEGLLLSSCWCEWGPIQFLPGWNDAHLQDVLFPLPWQLFLPEHVCEMRLLLGLHALRLSIPVLLYSQLWRPDDREVTLTPLNIWKMAGWMYLSQSLHFLDLDAQSGLHAAYFLLAALQFFFQSF